MEDASAWGLRLWTHSGTQLQVLPLVFFFLLDKRTGLKWYTCLVVIGFLCLDTFKRKKNVALCRSSSSFSSQSYCVWVLLWFSYSESSFFMDLTSSRWSGLNTLCRQSKLEKAAKLDWRLHVPSMFLTWIKQTINKINPAANPLAAIIKQSPITILTATVLSRTTSKMDEGSCKLKTSLVSWTLATDAMKGTPLKKLEKKWKV